MRKKSEFIFGLIQVPIDVLALLGSFALAFIIRARSEGHPLAYPIHGWEFIQVVVLVLPIWVVIFALSGLYSQGSLKSRWSELGRVVVAVSGGVMFMVLLDFFVQKPIFPSKAIPVYAYFIGLVVVEGERFLLSVLQRRLFRFGVGVRRVVVVGAGVSADKVTKALSNPATGYRVVERICDSQSLNRILNSAGHEIDEVVIAQSDINPTETLEMLKMSTDHYVSFRYAPSQLDMYSANSEFDSVAGVPMIEVRLTPLDGWGRVIKRLFDIFGSLFAITFFSPIMLVIALAVKISDPGPVLFRHKRMGRGGSSFGVMKFRTMSWKYSTGADKKYKTAEEAFIAMGREDLLEEFRRDQKVGDDPRVNKLGKFLRKSSLDELPQFFNVLKGDMSLVGPRPVLVEELTRYGERGTSFLALKPGLTGLWQVSGRNEVSYEDRVKLDVYYVENWNLWLDVQIILRTVLIVLTRRGAY